MKQRRRQQPVRTVPELRFSERRHEGDRTEYGMADPDVFRREDLEGLPPISSRCCLGSHPVAHPGNRVPKIVVDQCNLSTRVKLKQAVLLTGSGHVGGDQVGLG